jgi:hypothetical protein
LSRIVDPSQPRYPVSLADAWESIGRTWAGNSPREAFMLGAYVAKEMLFGRLSPLNLDALPVLASLLAELKEWRDRSIAEEEADDGRAN